MATITSLGGEIGMRSSLVRISRILVLTGLTALFRETPMNKHESQEESVIPILSSAVPHRFSQGIAPKLKQSGEITLDPLIKRGSAIAEEVYINIHLCSQRVAQRGSKIFDSFSGLTVEPEIARDL